MKLSIKPEGMDELIAGLKGLEEKSKTRITRNAARAGANDLKRRLKQSAPRSDKQSKSSQKYGRLSANIKVEQLKRDRFLPYYLVTTGDAFWGQFLDTGTGKQNTDPGPKSKGAAAKTHIKPNYWWRKTVEESRGPVTQKMLTSIGRSIQREVDKL